MKTATTAKSPENKPYQAISGLDVHTVLSLLANSSFMRLNLFRPILALKAHIIEITNIATGRVQKMILTASCAV